MNQINNIRLIKQQKLISSYEAQEREVINLVKLHLYRINGIIVVT